MARAARTGYAYTLRCYGRRGRKTKSSGISIGERTLTQPLWRKCRKAFRAINFWVPGLRHKQNDPLSVPRALDFRANVSAQVTLPEWVRGWTSPHGESIAGFGT